MSFRAGTEEGKHTKLHAQDNLLSRSALCVASDTPRIPHISEQESFVLHAHQTNFAASSSNLSIVLNNFPNFRQQTRNPWKNQLEMLAPGALSKFRSLWYWVRLLAFWPRQQSHTSFRCQYKLFFRITKPNIPDKLIGKIVQRKPNRYILKIDFWTTEL